MPTLKDLKNARVAVIGDGMTDVWHYGRWSKITGEGVPAFAIERVESTPGGAANVAEQVKALGATAHLLAKPEAEWPRKIRYSSRGTVFRADEETIHPIGEIEQAAIISALASISCDVLILSDYAKGTLTPSLCQQAIRWAKVNGVKVVVDPKGSEWDRYEGADVICPNTAEFEACQSNPWMATGAVLITKGADGISLQFDDRPTIDIPAVAREIYDVAGAGDTVVAVLSACLAVGYELPEAARIANAAAGVVVGKRGTATCSLKELEDAL